MNPPLRVPVNPCHDRPLIAQLLALFSNTTRERRSAIAFRTIATAARLAGGHCLTRNLRSDDAALSIRE